MSRKSATVLAFGDYRTKHRTVYFTRFELNQLLGLYSRHVTRGVWKHRESESLTDALDYFRTYLSLVSTETG